LPFDKLKQEALSLYPGHGSVAVWYHTERKKHPNWPSQPKKDYKEFWIDWPSLVDKPNRFKNERLPFEEFKQEVISLYPGSGDVQQWYRQEKKKYLHWPANPHDHYVDNWKGWSELVNLENRLKREWITFEKLRQEAASLYPGFGKADLWYYSERKKHPNWPSQPKKVYKNSGWRGFSYLVGNKN